MNGIEKATVLTLLFSTAGAPVAAAIDVPHRVHPQPEAIYATRVPNVVGSFAVEHAPEIVEFISSNVPQVVRRIGGCASGSPPAPNSQPRYNLHDTKTPDQPSGAYLIPFEAWDGFGGYMEAYMAPRNIQDKKAVQLAREDSGRGKYEHWGEKSGCWNIKKRSASTGQLRGALKP